MATSEFIVLFKEANPRWEPGCPVLLQTLQVSGSPSSSQRFIQSRVQNISSRIITSINYAVTSIADGKTWLFQDIDLELMPGESRPLAAREVDDARVDGVIGKIVSVSSSNGTWETSGETEDVPEALPLMLSEEAMRHRFELLEVDGFTTDANATGQVVQHGDWWICSCGQINVDTDTCVSCSVPKEEYLALESEQEIEHRYETIHKAEEKARDERSKNLKQALVIGISLACVIAAVAIGLSAYFNIIVPEQELASAYEEATSLMENGDYGQAKIRFLALDDYKDSSDRAQEADEALEQAKADKACEEARTLLESEDNPLQGYLKVETTLKSYAEYPEAQQILDEASSNLPPYPYLNAKDIFDLEGNKTSFLSQYGKCEKDFDNIYTLNPDNKVIDGDITIVGSTTLGKNEHYIFYEFATGKLNDPALNVNGNPFDNYKSLFVDFHAKTDLSYEEIVRKMTPIFGLEQEAKGVEIKATDVDAVAQGTLTIDGHTCEWTIEAYESSSYAPQGSAYVLCHINVK